MESGAEDFSDECRVGCNVGVDAVPGMSKIARRR